MATNWTRRKYGLRKWARAHKIDEPSGFDPKPNKCGRPCRRLIRLVKRKARLRWNNAIWTRALNDLIFPLSYGQLCARVAKAKLGVHEIGSTNTGKWVDIFLKAVYLPGGYQWCAAFATWVHIRAAIIQDIMDDTKDDYEVLRDVFHDLFYGNAAYVPNLVRGFRAGRKAHGWKAKTVGWDDVQAGDWIICWGDGHVETATGRVYVRGGVRYVPTIGGNNAGATNGGEVSAKQRVVGSEATMAGRTVPPKS